MTSIKRAVRWSGTRPASAILLVLVLFGGATAVFALPSQSWDAGRVIRIPIARSLVVEGPPNGGLCSGGPEPQVTVELVPDDLVVEKRRERLEYHTEITSHLDGPSQIAWTPNTTPEGRPRTVGQSSSRGAARVSESRALLPRCAITTPRWNYSSSSVSY